MFAHNNNHTKEFKAGLYLRLSREDGEGQKQSESITNQKDFLEKFAIENGYSIVDVYIDDGWSGTSFQRPDFQRMVADIEAKKINMVITKDLSRLGRDYIMTGHYLEKYFPSHNVRYIAVNDGIDTYEDNSANDLSPFKSVINDMYAKDISKKVRTTLTTKKLKGDFIGSNAPYGYKKSELDKNKLVINEETAPTIRMIFDLFKNGMNIITIANKLSQMNVPTPSEYAGIRYKNKRYSGVWNDAIIRRILTNPTYIGNVTQNRSKKVNYKMDKKVQLPPEQWIIVENSHEPIIDKSDFEAVRQIMAKRQYIAKERNITNGTHILSGLVFCAECGAPMSFSKESEHRTYMLCSTWRRYAKLKLCTSHCIREDYTERTVIQALQDIAAQHINKEQVLSNVTSNTLVQSANSLESERQALITRQKETQEYILSLYKDKVKGFLTEENFTELSNQLNKDKIEIANGIANVEKQINDITARHENREIICKKLDEFLSFQKIDRITLITLIDKIFIGKDKQIEVKFNFDVA